MKNLYIFLPIVVLLAVLRADAQIASRYTDLAAERCKTTELTDDEGGSYKGECLGVAGYKLEVIEGDLRQTINIISPNKKVHEMKLWEFFGGFSSVGPRAEWRLKGSKPIALIVRLNVNEDPEDPRKLTSYLLVAKITDAAACITDIVKPSRTQNADARRAADRAANRGCRNAGG